MAGITDGGGKESTFPPRLCLIQALRSVCHFNPLGQRVGIRVFPGTWRGSLCHVVSGGSHPAPGVGHMSFSTFSGKRLAVGLVVFTRVTHAVPGELPR